MQPKSADRETWICDFQAAVTWPRSGLLFWTSLRPGSEDGNPSLLPQPHTYAAAVRVDEHQRASPDDLSAAIAAVAHRAEPGRKQQSHLEEDHRRQIGTEIEGENRHLASGAFGEQVDHPKKTAGLPARHPLPHRGIDAGQRNRPADGRQGARPA
jgi:hypothetical protein